MIAVLLLCKLAELRSRQLLYKDSQDLYQKALRIAVDQQGEYLAIAGPALIGLGNLALEQYELENAERLLHEGIRITRRWNFISTLGGYLAMAMLHEAREDTNSLMETFKILHDLSQRFDASDFDDIIVEIVEMGIKARRGDLDAIHQWATIRRLEDVSYAKPKSDKENYLFSRMYKYQLPILIRLQIGEQNYDKALKFIERLSDEAIRSNRPLLQIETEILRAKTLHIMGDISSSLAALKLALELALPQESIRIFLVEGKEIIQLLETARSEWDSAELITFIDHILQKVEPTTMMETLPIQDLPEPLSPRELEILRLLPSRLTAEELAVVLMISVNTVRSHLKNIYTKLGVHSRHEAVARSNELNLL